MESWFVRLNKKIFMSSWFSDFMNSITAEQDKADITIKYEHGLTNLTEKNNCSWGGLYTVHGRATYNKPKYLFKHGCPFIKKLSFTRHNGELGKQIRYILKKCDKPAANIIIRTANELYGKDYMNWFLTFCYIKILARKIKYIFTKIKKW